MFDDRRILTQALSVLYRTMVASEALLKFAIPRAAGELLDYYKQHLEEERGHEVMLEDDLMRLGVEKIPHYFGAAQLAGSQYYLIAHVHPAMLLGYMKAMESSPMSLEMVEHLSSVHGTPMTCLKHHAIHDPSHKLDLDKHIARLPEDLKKLVDWNERNVRRLIASGVAEEGFSG